MISPAPLSGEFIYSPVINFALQQNHGPVIRKFIITNETGNDLSDLSVQLSCEPELANPTATRIALLTTGETIELNDVDLKLSAKCLSELTERVLGKIGITVRSGDQILFQEYYFIDVPAFDEWQGISILPEMISAFVTPNNPQIAVII